MPSATGLATIDWAIVLGYLALAMLVGIWVKERAEQGSVGYFLAGRRLPWWWVGTSIAATIFAADTPLAVSGITASRGLSGNWIWLSWIGVHAAVFVFFARQWRRSQVVTDAEFIELRYSGRGRTALRLLRAGLYGLVYNVIIIGWVLRAMTKIVSTYFPWEAWFPGLMEQLGAVLAYGDALGTPSEVMTVLLLLALVGTYSSLGGLQGVIVTDLVQYTLALVGSFWLAFAAWDRIGGRAGLHEQLAALYGEGHQYLHLLPSPDGWLSAVGIGAFAFGVYVIVQSYSNIPADGGGFFMQRLGASRSAADARKASLWFIGLQYLIQAWPWFVVGVSALVLIPLGQEMTALGGAGAPLADDRELAYPVLMRELLGPGILGLMLTGFLGAFMSTIDTHLNWGASYVVRDVYLRFRPDAPQRAQVRVARSAVLGFVVLAALVSFQIDTIEQAWRWVASIGAALGLPTALRWLWWRVNAAAELGAMALGLTTTALCTFVVPEVPYELSLIYITGASLVGMLGGIVLAPASDGEHLERFMARTQPRGLWPGKDRRQQLGELGRDALAWICVLGGMLGLMLTIHRILFFGAWGTLALGACAAAAVAWGARLSSDERPQRASPAPQPATEPAAPPVSSDA